MPGSPSESKARVRTRTGCLQCEHRVFLVQKAPSTDPEQVANAERSATSIDRHVIDAQTMAPHAPGPQSPISPSMAGDVKLGYGRASLRPQLMRIMGYTLISPRL